MDNEFNVFVLNLKNSSSTSKNGVINSFSDVVLFINWLKSLFFTSTSFKATLFMGERLQLISGALNLAIAPNDAFNIQIQNIQQA